MWKKALIVIALIVALFLAWHFGLFEALTLENFSSNRERIQVEVETHFFRSLLIYFVFYVLVTSLSIPGASVLTVAGGALFGALVGTVLVSFASTTGATVSFLLSRFLFRDWVENKFKKLSAQVNKGFEQDGVSYLLMLRLLPVMPFFVCNALMGLTRIPTWKYVVASQIGMLPATFLYVNAGTQLATIKKLSDILSIEVLISLCLLGIFPLLVQRVLKKWKKSNA
jgi:uncharacterized membrane protein YdjX (TVP38/TMEM64 family)